MAYSIIRPDRRQLIKGIGTTALLAGLGAPFIARAQSDTVKIGHLTPLTGFLGPLGEYAQLGVQLAVEQLNADGGINGKQIELLMEDSVNPATASTKAERYIKRDNVACIIGEISSASGLAIAQVVERNSKLFFNTGCNSDALRGSDCSRFMYHVEACNSQYVKGVGSAFLRDGLVDGKKIYFLTADYAYGQDLSRVGKKYIEANGGDVAWEDLVPTDSTDFSAYILKIRQARPDLIISNLAGNQITNFVKQYTEYGLEFPYGGFGFDTAVAWGAGKGNFGGEWPVVWHHNLSAPGAQEFVAAFTEKYGKPPENQAWGDYLATKLVAQAMAATKSTDAEALIEYFDDEPKLDILKARQGYFRKRDHQLIQEMYTMTAKPLDQLEDEWDLMLLGDAVPGADGDLEAIAPTEEENACSLSAA
ncbi:ABC transporter substrate-binding protein [Aurantimonas coralicida]|uniref:ABC transporter substrate-binding protein n=1 Tax=Aurantimonas coralicida TaxID=182270 RepID=UPI001E582FCC|nr:ABC transporter substrate-binding protein [Aurantimonas coralicida]MCD1645374.1 ABC transporter substrate-binding protein [Aurantimonas coralicida]